MRLPVESAKKLRWFDRQDLNMLIQLHLREKQELFEANAALRQVRLLAILLYFGCSPVTSCLHQIPRGDLMG